MHYNDDTRSLHGMLCNEAYTKDFEFDTSVITSAEEAQEHIMDLKERFKDRVNNSLEDRRLMKYSIKAIEQILR